MPWYRTLTRRLYGQISSWRVFRGACQWRRLARHILSASQNLGTIFNGNSIFEKKDRNLYSEQRENSDIGVSWCDSCQSQE